ncbi:uncharacterized protein [Triticum aestivum]|uniref:uncharacterized protein n=1 Tax=Triticum aestivum TaxID=4565 RepID=UPI000842B99B|nr:uncharacterized protein LOC123189372 [Triticum aestivum]
MRRRRPPIGSMPPPPPRSYAAGWDPASRIHVPASPSTLSAACTRRNTSRLPTSLPTLPSPQPRITPAGIHRAVHLVHACSPSLSARLTAEIDLLGCPRRPSKPTKVQKRKQQRFTAVQIHVWGDATSLPSLDLPRSLAVVPSFLAIA